MRHQPPSTLVRSRSAVLALACAASIGLAASPAPAQCGPPASTELSPFDPAWYGSLGTDVAIDGDAILAGAPNASGGGAVYVWRDAGGGWTFESRIPPPDGHNNGQFGRSVDLDGDVAAIGANISHDEGFVARYFGGAWTVDATIVPLDKSKSASFGSDVAIDGDWAAFGAPGSNTSVDNGTGAVYVFRHVSGAWFEHSILVPADAQTGDQFGYGVDLQDDVLVVGSMRWSSADPTRSAAHVYRLVGSAWTLETVVQPTSAGFGSYYGRCVATDGDVVLVSDIGDALEPSNSGAIYAYRFDGASWVEEQQLRAAMPGSHGYFGEELAIDGDELATSANNAGGRVWSFRRIAGQWLEVGATTSNVASGFNGWDLSIDGSRLVVGAANVDTGDTDSGAAYVLDLAAASLACTYCTAKVNSQGCTPTIASSGAPSASAGGGFTIGATQVLAGKPGLFFYGRTAVASTAFGGGLLCFKSPVVRTNVQHASGAGACGGAYAIDFNAWIASGADPALVAGEVVRGQFWSRDTGFAAPNNIGLTDAISFVIAP